MSNIRVVQGADGIPIFTVQNAKDYHVAGLGTMSGNVAFSVQTVKDDQSLFDFQNLSSDSSMEFSTTYALNRNYGFHGSDISASLGEGDDFVLWDVQNGTLLSNGGSDSVDLSTDSSDSQVDLGAGDNTAIDEGQYNIIIARNGNNNIATTEDSIGSIIMTKGGLDNIVLGGKHAFVDSGYGDDTIVLNDTSMDSFVYGNNGDDNITNNGSGSYRDAETDPGTATVPSIFSLLEPFTDHETSYNFLATYLEEMKDTLGLGS